MVCKDCEFNNTPNAVSFSSRCKECGCVLEAKSRVENGKCPRDKWPL